MKTFIACLIFLSMLTSCGTLSDGTTLQMSKGQATGLGKFVGGAAEYCKLFTQDPDYVITESDKAMLSKYCTSEQMQLFNQAVRGATGNNGS